MATRIFLVDDHPIILQSLKDVFRSTKGFEVIGEAKTPQDAREQIMELEPDVAIIDLTLQEGSGLDLIEDLHTANPDVRVVVYSMRETIQTISDVYRAGALAYVPKSGDPFEVVKAVKSAMMGRHYFVGNTAERLGEFHAKGNPDDPARKLTSREFDIYKLAAQGLECDEIAERLRIGAPSVSNRLVKIRKKLGVTSQIQFTRLALKYGHIHTESLDV